MWDGSVAAGVELTVKSKVALEEAYLGCSIAVNGVCLTATSLEKDQVSQYFKISQYFKSYNCWTFSFLLVYLLKH